MCRLAMFRYWTHGKTTLTAYLQGLEKSIGGHGNGVAVLGKKPVVTKGVKLDAEECASLILSGLKNDRTVLFHTRRTSAGETCDAQCHPFLERNGLVVAHNGHWFAGATVAKAFELQGGSWSDTMVFAHLLGQHGEQAMRAQGMFPTCGVWLIARRHKVRVLKLSGELRYCPELGLWASEIPAWVGESYEVADGRHAGDKRPRQEKVELFEKWSWEDEPAATVEVDRKPQDRNAYVEFNERQLPWFYSEQYQAKQRFERAEGSL